MDILAFLKQRTAFIRQFYTTSVAPFEEHLRKIRAEEPPYEPSANPYKEDDEPEFLLEYIEAEESVTIVGYSCITMLSSSLHLFFKTWDSEIGLKCPENRIKKLGWPNAYMKCWEERLGIRWEDGPCDFEIVERIVLSRNAVQHPQTIVFNTVRHSPDARKLKSLFFVDDRERRLFPGTDLPEVNISKEQFYTALEEVEKFCSWLDSETRAKLGWSS